MKENLLSITSFQEVSKFTASFDIKLPTLIFFMRIQKCRRRHVLFFGDSVELSERFDCGYARSFRFLMIFLGTVFNVERSPCTNVIQKC